MKITVFLALFAFVCGSIADVAEEQGESLDDEALAELELQSQSNTNETLSNIGEKAMSMDEDELAAVESDDAVQLQRLRSFIYRNRGDNKLNRCEYT